MTNHVDFGAESLARALVPRLLSALAEQLDGQNKLIDRRELARRLKLSERGVTGLVNRGELHPGYLIGGVRRWRWDEVLKHLGTRQVRRRRGRGIRVSVG